jgi:hypothetical protein
MHVSTSVLLPADKTIVQTAQALPSSASWSRPWSPPTCGCAVGNGPLTVFAPTNAAFAALLAELGVSKDALLADTALLTKVLTYHVVPARVLKADVPVGTAITTCRAARFTVDATLAITDQRGRKASITATDVLASNGVIHVIDKVILPRALKLPSPPPPSTLKGPSHEEVLIATASPPPRSPPRPRTSSTPPCRPASSRPWPPRCRPPAWSTPSRARARSRCSRPPTRRLPRSQGRPRRAAEGQGQADRGADLPRGAGQGDGQADVKAGKVKTVQGGELTWPPPAA